MEAGSVLCRPSRSDPPSSADPIVIRVISILVAVLACAGAAHGQSAGEPAAQDSVVALPSVARRPQLTNMRAVVGAIASNYPDALRGTGIAGPVIISMVVDSAGQPHDISIATPSGEALLDAAALRVAEVMRFRPAEIRLANGQRRPVAVRLQVPLTFSVAAEN
jgi:TonB family protein